jgi:glycosyltransferase involved in cell wall biosynthesis
MPFVSVIVPLHNKGSYVAHTLASVQAQSLENWELIVVENGSTDGGPQVVEKVAAADGRIRLINAPASVSGPCGARNLGIERARGEWLLFLDADDWIEAEHLQRLVAAGQSASADVVAGGWSEIIEGSDAMPVVRDGPTEGATAAMVLDSCLAFAPWAVHAALVRREWLPDQTRWPLEMERLPSEDSVFWFRILHGAKLATVPTHSAVYRKGTPENRDAHRDLTLWIEAILRVIELNEIFLHGRGHHPSPTQATHVMRSLESLWLRCREAGAGSEGRVVERETKRWLAMAAVEPALLLRRVIGPRGFNALRQVIRKWR